MVARLSRRGPLLAGVAGLALLARLPLLFLAPTPVDDTDSYFGVATLWLHGADDPGARPVGVFRTPGYALSILPFEPLPGDWYHAVGIFHHALGIAVAVAVAALAYRWFGASAAAIAGAVAATSPLLVAAERVLTPDVLFTAVVLAAAALLVEAVRRDPPSTWLLAAAGAAFGVAAYVKPVAQCFLLAGVLPLAVATRSLRATVRGSLVLALALALVVAPWIARNWAVDDRPAMTSVGGMNLYLRVFDYRGVEVPDDTDEGARVAAIERAIVARGDEPPDGYLAFEVNNELERRGMDEDDAADLQGRVALTAIRRDPLSHLGATLDGVAEFAELVPKLSVPGAYPAGEELPRTEVWGARGLAFRVWQLGAGLARVWWVLTLHGLLVLALLFWGRREERAAVAALAGTWLLLATATSISSPVWDGFTRFPAQGAPLMWIACSAALAVAAPAVIAAVRERRRRPAARAG